MVLQVVLLVVLLVVLQVVETKVEAAGQKPEGCTAWEFTFGVEVQLKI